MQFRRTMLCVPKSSQKATETAIKYWAGTWMYFQYCKSPVSACLHLLPPIFSQAYDWTKPFFCFYSKMMLPLLLTGDSKLNPVLAVYLPQKRLFYSSQSAAMVYKAGPWPLVNIQRGVLWFKFLTQGSLGQRCGGVGTSRSLGFISASGTPQRYRSWLLCSSLLLMRGPSYWQKQDERRGQKGIFFILGWVGFLPMHSW